MFFRKNSGNIIGFIICALSGVILHFAYEWSGENTVVSLFSAVNESTWEHLKLLFYPVTVYTFFQWLFFCRKEKSFLFSRVLSLFVSMLFIVTAFYTISGIIGKNDISVINIGIFVLSVALCFWLTEIINRSIFATDNKLNIIALIIYGVFILLFTVFTFMPPSIGLFRQP